MYSVSSFDELFFKSQTFSSPFLTTSTQVLSLSPPYFTTLHGITCFLHFPFSFCSYFFECDCSRCYPLLQYKHEESKEPQGEDENSTDIKAATPLDFLSERHHWSWFCPSCCSLSSSPQSIPFLSLTQVQSLLLSSDSIQVQDESEENEGDSKGGEDQWQGSICTFVFQLFKSSPDHFLGSNQQPLDASLLKSEFFKTEDGEEETVSESMIFPRYQSMLFLSLLAYSCELNHVQCSSCPFQPSTLLVCNLFHTLLFLVVYLAC